MRELGIFWVMLLCCGSVAGQSPCSKTRPPLPPASLESKLAQKATFIPGGKTVTGQLVEVARHYRLPMGVEFVGEPAAPDAPPQVEPGVTVSELINAILRNAPDHQARVYDGVVHVAHLAAAASPNNFLNMRLSRYKIEDANLFEAESKLRLMINSEMFPDLYKQGFGGGGGYRLDHTFASTCVTFQGSDLTIRDALNGIARESGNSLWVVTLRTEELKAEEPAWRQRRPDEYGHAAINTRWRFIPFDDGGAK
jgi:hypothetical protein